LPGLSEHAPSNRLYRIGRAPNPWAWPDWGYADPVTGTFGKRWDDPRGIYRVLYSSSSRLGCYLETLAGFRPDPQVVAALQAIENNEPTLPKTQAAAEIPASWAANRRIGQAEVSSGVFADIATAQSLGYLNRELAALLIEFGLRELDAAAIRTSAPRAFTQRISRYVFEASNGNGGPFAGIYYESRLGDNVHNFAIFEGANRWKMTTGNVEQIKPDDSELAEALAILGVSIDWSA
jgi:RES domain-containing protein